MGIDKLNLLQKAIQAHRLNPNPPPAPEKILRSGAKVAPLGGFQGTNTVRPGQFAVTVVLPHLNTVEQLKLAVGLWRCQTVRPFICVIDTGSPWEVVEDLEHNLRATDCEIHYIRGHGYKHSSEPVTAALDLSHTRCQTEYLFHTHTDVFPKRKDFLQFMIGKCSHKNPVVGWQMSPRNNSTLPTKDEWKECVSHTATMLHMPTIHRGHCTWAMEMYYAHRPEDRKASVGWPDTESPFLLSMRKAGITPELLGPEPNFQFHRLTTDDGREWADHARSYTGLVAHSPATEKLRIKAESYMQQAMADARKRLRDWTDPTGCEFRSAESTGTVKCPSCRGTVELKVFDCSKHKSCVLGKEGAGHKNCTTCPDRKN